MILLHIGNCFPFTEIDDVENRKVDTCLCNIDDQCLSSEYPESKGFEDSEDLFELVKWR